MRSRFRCWSLSVCLVISVVVLLSACETVIEIDPPDYDPELHIVSKFSPDSTWATQLTSTIPLSTEAEPTDILVENASILIYDGDILVDRLIHDKKNPLWYVSSQNHTPELGTLYRIVVEAPGFTSVSATSMAPPSPVLFDAEIEEIDDFDDPFSTEEYWIRFSLENPPGLNYFAFSIFQGGYADSSLGWTRYTLTTMHIIHDSRRWYCRYDDVLNPISIGTAEADERCSIGILSDRSLQNQSRLDFELRTTYYEYLTEDEEPPNQDSRFVLLVVQSLSPEYMEYHSSLENQYDYDGFEEAVNIYSNIDGGRGVFAGYSLTYQLFNLSEME